MARLYTMVLNHISEPDLDPLKLKNTTFGDALFSLVGERGFEPPVSGTRIPRIRPLCYSPLDFIKTKAHFYMRCGPIKSGGFPHVFPKRKTNMRIPSQFNSDHMQKVSRV